MVINEYVNKWCNEEYNIKDEAFYQTQVNYVLKRSMAMNGGLHGIVVIVLCVLYCVYFGKTVNIGSAFELVKGLFTLSGTMGMAYAAKALFLYGQNRNALGNFAYVITFVFLLLLPEALIFSLSIGGIVSFAYFSVYVPVSVIRMTSEIKRQIDEMQAEESRAYEESWKGQKASWTNEDANANANYNSYTGYGNNAEAEHHSSNDEYEKAKALFDGYTSDMTTLKTRYRQLAKEHHPDHGGDTALFQQITSVYNDLKKSFE